MKPNMFRSISRLMMAAVVVSLPLTGMARTKAQAKTPAQAQSQTQGKAPKYIFYYIGDGMGIAHVTNTNNYKSRVLGQQMPLTMTTFPVAAMATTYSASSDVTDSAAAGTALATGSKTKNGMLGTNADTLAVTSVAKKLFDDGYGVGLITTVAIDDATPGAFYAHVANRNQHYDIGRQLAESGYQFAAGAGLRGTKDKQGNDSGLLDYFAENNVSVSYGLDGLDSTASRLLVLSPMDNPNEIGYAIDSIPGALTLPGLTQAGLNHLEKVSPDRFFMMVEGGSIDHAGHSNDGGTVVREVISFDQALQIAYNFYLAHPDETLIVVTADHETGGMSVGCQATGYSQNLKQMRSQKISKDEFAAYCRSMLKSRMIFTWEDMLQYMADNLGVGTAIEFTPEEMEKLHGMFNEVFERRNEGITEKTLYSSADGFTREVYRLLNEKSGIGWTTNCHTGSPVPVFAIGVGAQEFNGMNDNTDLPAKILKIAGK